MNKKELLTAMANWNNDRWASIDSSEFIRCMYTDVSYEVVKKERDEYLNLLQKFDEMASEKTYLEATLWLKKKVAKVRVELAKRMLNEGD